jgi:hypothetical protein
MPDGDLILDQRHDSHRLLSPAALQRMGADFLHQPRSRGLRAGGKSGLRSFADEGRTAPAGRQVFFRILKSQTRMISNTIVMAPALNAHHFPFECAELNGAKVRNLKCLAVLFSWRLPRL